MNSSAGKQILELAEVKDISTLATLAERIWWEHYPAIITYEQIRYMLKKMYSTEVLQKQISGSQQIFYLIKSEKDAVGFIAVSETDSGNWMLHKFYLLKENRTQGLGSIAFRQLVPLLKNPKTIRLTVNRMNGFIIEKVADFDIGNGFFMNDFVMIWEKKNLTGNQHHS
jgi:hypothetical protein